ncbi:MAG: hypothetical protein ACTSXW_03220 [Candidatus Baldrarchaeia archaeon]|mgnify:CR=1 FL=1
MAKFLAMLEIEGGEAHPIPISTMHLSPDRTIIIIDEDEETMYLFIGRDVGLVSRRMAERVTQSIKTYGFKYGNTIIGKNCHNLVIIDEKEIGTSFKEVYQDLIKKIELWETLGKSLVDIEKEKPKPIRKVKTPIKHPLSPEIEEKKEKIEKVEPFRSDISSKIGFVVLKLLDKFPEMFVGKTSKNNAMIIRFEGPQGFLGEVVISNNRKIDIRPNKEFETEFKEILKGIKKESLEYFA